MKRPDLMSTPRPRSTGAPEPASEGSVRSRIGRYELCFELASGGMGTVYLGRVEGAGGFARAVAIKTIHPHLAKIEACRNMFLDEARICAQLTHPNVCSVFDFGEDDGVYFLAMEYLLGEPLSHVLRAVRRQGRLGADLQRLPLFGARIVADAAEGLHAAHELCAPDGAPLAVVHRDVSPQNIFVTYDGAVKVVDFGVAKAEQRLHQTRAGAGATPSCAAGSS